MNCSLNSDERQFVENISWDTDSEDEDFEIENEIAKQNAKTQGEGEKNLEDNFNHATHSFNRTYLSPSPYLQEDVKAILRKSQKQK